MRTMSCHRCLVHWSIAKLENVIHFKIQSRNVILQKKKNLKRSPKYVETCVLSCLSHLKVLKKGRYPYKAYRQGITLKRSKRPQRRSFVVIAMQNTVNRMILNFNMFKDRTFPFSRLSLEPFCEWTLKNETEQILHVLKIQFAYS